MLDSASQLVKELTRRVWLLDHWASFNETTKRPVLSEPDYWRDGQLLGYFGDLRSRVVCTEFFIEICFSFLDPSLVRSFGRLFANKSSVLLYLLGSAFEAMNQIPGNFERGKEVGVEAELSWAQMRDVDGSARFCSAELAVACMHACRQAFEWEQLKQEATHIRLKPFILGLVLQRPRSKRDRELRAIQKWARASRGQVVFVAVVIVLKVTVR